MPWLRISLTTPTPGSEAEVEKLFGELENVLSSEPGFVMGGCFSGGHERGRFSIWNTKEDADKAAAKTNIQMIRSSIHNLIQAGHQESLFEITGAQHNIPSK